MSVNTLLTMKCSIDKRDGNTFDEYGNSQVAWSSVSTNVSCYIHPIVSGLSAMRIDMKPVSGENITGNYYGFFKSTQEIEIGYRILLDDIYYYVLGGAPIFNPKKAKVSHKEFILSLETT
jgi:hypothetical protein